MMAGSILLANGDLFGVIVFLVVIIISAISQAIGNKKQAQQQRPKPQPRPRPPVRPAQAGGRPQPRDPVASELEEFLRRASGGRKPPAQPQGPPQVPVAQPVPPRPVAAQPVVEIEELDELEPLPEQGEYETGEPRWGAILSRQHRSSDAGESVHSVGQLKSRETEAAHAAALAGAGSTGNLERAEQELPPTAAAGLAAMLSDGDNLRQAIVLSEILDRPEQRWS